MPFYKRGLLYLLRKRSKSLLLFLVLLFVCCMILGASMILHATERTRTAMQRKAQPKVICEITDVRQPITNADIAQLTALSQAARINRMASQAAGLQGLMPVTYSDGSDADNGRVTVYSYDDMENDGPLADGSYELTEGSPITHNTDHGAVIHQQLAANNHLAPGDEITLEAEDGSTATVTVIGLFLAGNEARQNEAMAAVYRIENQIYIDNSAYLELFDNGGFYKLSITPRDPSQLEALAKDAANLLQAKAEVTTSDALLSQMEAPLTQITRAAGFMRLLTFFTGTAVLSLLLCMWMRGRSKEMAVFMSLGEPKSHIFLQALQESAILFLCAAALACILGALSAGQLTRLLSASLSESLDMGQALPQISLGAADAAQLFGIGAAVVMIAVGLSLLPVITANPKDTLSQMEG